MPDTTYPVQEYYLVALAQQRLEEEPSQVMKSAVSAAMGKLVSLLLVPESLKSRCHVSPALHSCRSTASKACASGSAIPGGFQGQ